MLRRVLTAYLAFLMAAAPCLCCCTFGRAMAAAPAQPAESQPPCCCHDESPQPAPTRVPSTPDSQDRCPCREHAEKQALVGPAIDPIAVRSIWDPVGLDFASVAPPVTGLSIVVQSGSFDRGEPYPSTVDLLHAHHRLRC